MSRADRAHRLTLEAERAKLDAEIARTDAELDRYFAAFENGTMPEQRCGERIEALSRRRSGLKSRCAPRSRRRFVMAIDLRGKR